MLDSDADVVDDTADGLGGVLGMLLGEIEAAKVVDGVEDVKSGVAGVSGAV